MIVPMTKPKSDDIIPSIVQAAFDGDFETVARLINQGVSVNSVDPRDNLTLLHIACLQGQEELVQVILERHRTHGDVDFTIRSNFRPRLAWQYAATGGFWGIAEAVQKEGLVRQSVPAGPKPQS